MSAPKGTLIIIGGADDKENERTKKLDMAYENKDFKDLEILKLMLTNNSKSPTIEIITPATNEPDETGKDYKEAFAKIGCK